MQNVTSSSKKASTEAHIQCRSTGLFMADASQDFNVISVSPLAARALYFPDADAAQHARKFIAALYPSFDWQVVPA